MMKFSLFILGALLTVAFSRKIAPPRVDIVEKNFNEIISVNLKKANEDIRFVVSIFNCIYIIDLN